MRCDGTLILCKLRARNASADIPAGSTAPRLAVEGVYRRAILESVADVAEDCEGIRALICLSRWRREVREPLIGLAMEPYEGAPRAAARTGIGLKRRPREVIS